MKKLFRSATVQTALGWLLGVYLRLMRDTVRWTHHGSDKALAAVGEEGPAIGLFWHSRIPYALIIPRTLAKRRVRGFVSPSSDGEFIAQALERSGISSFRGSSAKPGDSEKKRTAAVAFRAALTWLKDGGTVVMTPDGPRGPNEAIAPGAVQLALRSGAPVFLAGLATAPHTHLGGWDQMQLGRPFGRGAAVWVGPLFAGEADPEALAAAWSAQLSAATRRAEALAAGDVDPGQPG